MNRLWTLSCPSLETMQYVQTMFVGILSPFLVQLAAQQHELTLTRHYETLLLSRESQGMAGESVSNAHVSYSLQRLSHHLRDLIYSMAGESAAHDSIHHPDFDPDDEPVDFIDMSELLELLDQMEIKAGGGYPGTDDNRQDWAVEREYEISRLENENEELRRMLGIDAESIRNAGVDMEAEVANMAPPRHPGLSERYHSMQDSGDRWEVRPSYWDANGGGDGGDGGVNSQPFHPPPPPPPQQQLQQQQQMNTSGARLQRAVELPGGAGMRLPQGRRPGIFGAGQQRGALNAGTGRGISAISVPSPQSGLWSNLPPSPAPILADRVTIDRPWQLQTGSNLDLSR